VCPNCRRPFDPALWQFQPRLQPPIIRILKTQYPGWEPEDAVCPECVHEAVEHARRLRSPTSIHPELLLPFPVYSRDEAELLPTPIRVHANPNYTGQGVTMAFLDSGFYPHPDLTRPRNRILQYVDATRTEPVEKDNFKKRHVTSWHGLMTSSIGAGNGFMSEGRYLGIASRASLVLVKTGNPRGRGIRERDIYRALKWVIANRERFNIRVVNISLGGDHASTGKMTDLDELVEEAVAQGMVVVAAGGNGGVRRVIPPASAPSAITVGGLNDQNSLDRRLHRMYPSNYGLGATKVAKPEVIAPAVWLAAPMLPQTSVHNEALFLWQLDRASDEELARFLKTNYAQSRFKKETLRLPLDQIRRVIRTRMIEHKYIHPHYQHVDGTSMAAPIVSAVAAQMIEANPNLMPAEIKSLLLATAEPLDGAPEERQGAGVIHAGKAVAAALRAHGSPLKGWPTSPDILRRSITFYYIEPKPRADEVALIGSFNHWQPKGHALQALLPGVWQITIPSLPRGTYRYKFLVDRERWVNDPENPARVEDGFGGFNSILEV
jgi:serine protease AprX